MWKVCELIWSVVGEGRDSRGGWEMTTVRLPDTENNFCSLSHSWAGASAALDTSPHWLKSFCSQVVDCYRIARHVCKKLVKSREFWNVFFMSVLFVNICKTICQCMQELYDLFLRHNFMIICLEGLRIIPWYVAEPHMYNVPWRMTA